MEINIVKKAFSTLLKLTGLRASSLMNWSKMSHQEAADLLGGKMNLRQMEGGFDEQLNHQFTNETSRTVKICMLKHKCILMFSFMLISILQFVYIVFTQLMDDKDTREVLLQMANLLTTSANVTSNG